jgi:BirA family biotin operon repressor/biotin-[acetyl-CoA-carboxylase] ligase
MAKRHDIIWLESVDSTNEECRRRISDIDNLSVVAALSQTSGKGQRGNVWLSEAGQNLTFSIVLKFPAKGLKAEMEPMLAYDQFVLSEITSLAIVDLLADFGIEAKIKWPNDIYVGDRKICGMLIENSLRGEWIQHSIIGIGLNVNQRNFDVTLPNPTSMVLCSEFSCASSGQVASDSVPHYELQDLLEKFMDIFQDYMEEYIHNNRLSSLKDIYTSALWRLDIVSLYKDLTAEVGSIIKGKITGITDEGLLKIDIDDCGVKTFAFKDVAYII